MMITGKGWTMHRGDCLEVMAGMEAKSVDHVITDPPYEAEAHGNSRRMANGKAVGHSMGFEPMTEGQRLECGAQFCRLGKRWVLAFCQVEAVSAWRAAIPYRWVRAQVWIKPDSTPQLTGDRPAQGYECIATAHAGGKMRWNGGGRRGVYTHGVHHYAEGRNGHPTEKPLGLMQELVSLFTDPGDLILDPFAGSGTTGVAALRLGRRFIGIEKDPTYFQLACDRLRAEEQDSTLQAQRAGQGALFK